MMDQTTITVLLTSLVTLIAGGGGIFTFISARKKQQSDDNSSSTLEWKSLYDEMKQRLDDQEKDNCRLRQDVINLQQEISKLNIELNTYKKFDTYVGEMEVYIDGLLAAIKPLISESAYRSLQDKKPQRYFWLNEI